MGQRRGGLPRGQRRGHHPEAEGQQRLVQADAGRRRGRHPGAGGRTLSRSFPLPDEFFPLLLTRQTPLLEVYFRTLPYLSWMQILIGDPLYQPFKVHPAIRLPKLSPEGAPEQKMVGRLGVYPIKDFKTRTSRPALPRGGPWGKMVL